MNTTYLQTLSQSILAKAVNDVNGHSENESYSFADLANHSLDELGFDDLDIVEFMMNMENMACIAMDDSFFMQKSKKGFFKKQEETNFNIKLTFREIADYLCGLMYSSLNS